MPALNLPWTRPNFRRPVSKASAEVDDLVDLVADGRKVQLAVDELLQHVVPQVLTLALFVIVGQGI